MIRSLYFWVLIAIASGMALGVFSPEFAVRLKAPGDWFVAGIKFLVAPLIFTTVGLGIARSGSGRSAARIGLRAFLYFEVVSTLALGIGIAVGNLVSPGSGFPVASSGIDSSLVQPYLAKRGSLLNPFASGINLIQVLILSIAWGIVLLRVPDLFRIRANNVMDAFQKKMFRITGWYMWLAPLGAGCAMAFTVGHFGIKSLAPLVSLMACFYITCLAFIVLVLGLILRWIRIPLFSFLRYIREEILLVLGTSSSESALAPLMEKLRKLGCEPGVVGLVVPTGYSFNLDGTNIYLTLAVLFIAQAFQVNLGIGEQAGILLFAMLSSKGASGVTGAGFITLAATLSVVPEVPVAGLTLILGIDRFMSEARAITNMIGNAVGAIVIAHGEGALNREVMAIELSGKDSEN
jgi:aerobic C4-dicarboxylate transport protein